MFLSASALIFFLGSFFLILVLSSTLSIIYCTIKYGISPMPTAPKVKRQLLQIDIALKPGPIYELGSGWGTVAFALAKKYPCRSIEAYELSPVPYLFCLIRNFFLAHPNLHFHRRDFFQIPLNDASMIFCYLYPAAMHRLYAKLKLELAPKAVIITHTFALPYLHPYLKIRVEDLYHTKIYVYQIGLKN